MANLNEQPSVTDASRPAADARRAMPLAIQTQTTIELHTRGGVSLFDGRDQAGDRIVGLNRYAAKLRLAWEDAKRGDPWANQFLLQTEELLQTAETNLRETLEQLAQQYNLPGFDITVPTSTAPVRKTISSLSPYPYKAAQAIVLADKLIAKILSLRHNGFVAEDESRQRRTNAMRVVRAVLEHSTRYMSARQFGGSQEEVETKMTLRLGQLSDEIKSGMIKPKFGPTVDPAKARKTQILFKKGGPRGDRTETKQVVPAGTASPGQSTGGDHAGKE